MQKETPQLLYAHAKELKYWHKLISGNYQPVLLSQLIYGQPSEAAATREEHSRFLSI